MAEYLIFQWFFNICLIDCIYIDLYKYKNSLNIIFYVLFNRYYFFDNGIMNINYVI